MFLPDDSEVAEDSWCVKSRSVKFHTSQITANHDHKLKSTLRTTRVVNGPSKGPKRPSPLLDPLFGQHADQRANRTTRGLGGFVTS